MHKLKAISIIERQLLEIEDLKNISIKNYKFKQWKTNTQDDIKSIFGSDSEEIKKFNQIYYESPVGTFGIIRPSSRLTYGGDYCYSNNRSSIDNRDNLYNSGLEDASILLKSLIRKIEMYWSDQEQNSNIPPPNTIQNIELICNRFHQVAGQMRSRYNNRSTLEINDEYDVQDLFHSLLTLYFSDIRREESNASFAGSSSRSDFLLKPEQTVIEIKKTRPGLNNKKLGEELILDINKYQTHPDCKTLICFVYDPDERISNPRGLERDLEQVTDRIKVKVFIR